MAPDMCCGRFVKFNLIGKPGVQTTDEKHYVAISYAGIQGFKLDEMVFDEQK